MDCVSRFCNAEIYVCKYEQIIVVHFERYQDIDKAFQPLAGVLSPEDHQSVHGLFKVFRKQLCECLDILEQRTGKGAMRKITLRNKLKLAFEDGQRLEYLSIDLRVQLKLLQDSLKKHKQVGHDGESSIDDQTAYQQVADTPVRYSCFSDPDFQKAINHIKLTSMLEQLSDTSQKIVDKFSPSHPTIDPLGKILADLCNQRDSLVELRAKVRPYWKEMTPEERRSIDDACWKLCDDFLTLKTLVKARKPHFRLFGKAKKAPVSDEQLREAAAASTAQ